MKCNIEDLAINVDDVMNYTTINSKEEAYSWLEFFRSKVSKSVFPNNREYLIEYLIRLENGTIYFR